VSELLSGNRPAPVAHGRLTWRAWVARALYLGLLALALVAILLEWRAVYLWALDNDTGLPGWIGRHMDERVR
jgi:hypothetical protein